DAGGVELMTAPVEMVDVAGEVVRRTTPLASSAEIQLALHSDGQPAAVEVDPDRMQQVLLILIDNAIKHTPRGGKVQVRLRRHGPATLGGRLGELAARLPHPAPRQ